MIFPTRRTCISPSSMPRLSYATSLLHWTWPAITSISNPAHLGVRSILMLITPADGGITPRQLSRFPVLLMPFSRLRSLLSLLPLSLPLTAFFCLFSTTHVLLSSQSILYLWSACFLPLDTPECIHRVPVLRLPTGIPDFLFRPFRLVPGGVALIIPESRSS